MDKRMTIEEVVSEWGDRMAIGIGGWRSRRGPTVLVRGILRSLLTGVPDYGGDDAPSKEYGVAVREVVH